MSSQSEAVVVAPKARIKGKGEQATYRGEIVTIIVALFVETVVRGAPLEVRRPNKPHERRPIVE